MTALLAWYAVHGRRLAIRGTRDPYAIWVGEVMSQQTQIGRAGEAMAVFLARFPDVPALASATIGDVLRAWGDLGYPRRAVALRGAARTMVERHGGELPRSVAALQALPGVGPYTARAIASTAFGVPVTALDVNARRVIGRVLDGVPLPAIVPPNVQAHADALAPARHAADWNHALMDLGACVCRPTPDCSACPFRAWCAHAAGRVPDTGAAPRSHATVPFHATNRHVRGRILTLLRDAPAGVWVVVDPEAIGIDADRVGRATRELVAEGLIESPAGDALDRPRIRLSST